MTRFSFPLRVAEVFADAESRCPDFSAGDWEGAATLAPPAVPALDRLDLAVLRRAAGDVEAVDRGLVASVSALRLAGLVSHRLVATEAGRAALEAVDGGAVQLGAV
jgi:hypothetical protein